MESFLNRYRNITVLLLVIFAQLVLLAMQVKNDQDVRVIRVWAVTAVTPAARIVEWFRGGSIGFLRRYILLHDADAENRRLHDEVGRLRIENTFLRNELSTADRAKALQLFQTRTPSKMLAANVIGMGAGSNSKTVLVSRGSVEGVMRGMAVVTPDGIVGKVISAYPTASEVMLITDPEFAAGVISQKSQARGTLKGQGTPLCKVDYIPFEEKVEAGEWFYTSGDDRIFPRGFAVGVAKSVRPGQPFKEILVEPSGLQHGMEDVLIIMQSVHQAVPDTPPVNQPVYIAPAPPAPQAPAPGAAPGTAESQPANTEADKLRSIYKSVGDAQKHNFGEGPPGTKPPDFTHLPSTPLPPSAEPAPGTKPAAPATGGGPAAGTKSGTPAGAPAKTGPAVSAPATNPSAPAGAPAKTGPVAPGTNSGGRAAGTPDPAVRLNRQATGPAAPAPQTKPGSPAPPRKPADAPDRSAPPAPPPANKTGAPAKAPGGAPPG